MTSGSRDSERRCTGCGQYEHAGRHHGRGATWQRHEFTPPAAPPPVEGETERCASCGRGPGYVAVSYDGGATVKRECVRTDCRATEPDSPPVVAGQPEETDTVNDESAHIHSPSGRHAPFEDVCTSCRGPILWDFDAQRWIGPVPPAVWADVRVEWGVRYRWLGSKFDAERVRHDRTPKTQARAVELAGGMRLNPQYADVEACRIETRWVPVTDEGTDR